MSSGKNDGGFTYWSEASSTIPAAVSYAFVEDMRAYFAAQKPIQPERGNRKFAGERWIVSLKPKKNLA
jgi:hypothetical protein